MPRASGKDEHGTGREGPDQDLPVSAQWLLAERVAERRQMLRTQGSQDQRGPPRLLAKPGTPPYQSPFMRPAIPRGELGTG